MDGDGLSGTAGKLRVILPVILRIAFCLGMWTLGAMTMTIAEAQAQENRFARDTAVGGTRIGNRARLADAGHDVSCAASSERIALRVPPTQKR